jgi:carbon monoxide dehydrogenase subunit G
MQIDESFELPFSRAVVWQAFQNVKLLVDCLPGAQLVSADNQIPLELSFQIKMGPIAAAFSGQGAIDYDAENYAGSFSGQGTDRKNNTRVKGEARFFLLESPGPSTTVKVSVEFALTGALAQFGRIGVVKEIATNITAQFAANLKQRLVPEAVGPMPSDATQSVVQASTSLNLGNLFWDLLKQRIKRFFGRG